MTWRTAARRWGGLLVATGLLVGLMAAPTLAQGDSALDRLIADPGPGWSPAAGDVIAQVVKSERTALAGATSSKVQVAAKGWIKGDQRVFVVLVSQSSTIADGARQAHNAVQGLCTGGGGTVLSFGEVAAVPTSAQGTCAGGNAANVTATSWVRGNVIALVISGGVPTLDLETIVISQYATIPEHGVDAGGPSDTTIIGGVVIGILALVGIVLWIGFVNAKRQARRAAAGGDDPSIAEPIPGAAPTGEPPDAPGAEPGTRPPDAIAPPPPTIPPPPPAADAGPPPGWHPVAGDAYRQAYWDGNAWTARIHWDGSAWVREA